MNLIEINTFPRDFCDCDFGTVVEDDDIPRLNINEVIYSEFFKNYLCSNKPCILKSVSNNWGCFKYWVADNKPNFQYFLENYSKFKYVLNLRGLTIKLA